MAQTPTSSTSTRDAKLKAGRFGGWLLVFLAAGYILSPGHPHSLLRGVPLDWLGLAALATLGCLVFAFGLPDLSRTGVATGDVTRAGVVHADVIPVRVAPASIAPAGGLATGDVSMGGVVAGGVATWGGATGGDGRGGV